MVRHSWALVITASAILAGCNRHPAGGSPLRRSAYVWQRQWTSAVSEAVTANAAQLDGIVALGAEIEWKATTTRVRQSDIDWAALKHCGQCGIALRVTAGAESLRVEQFPFAAITTAAETLLTEAKRNEVPLTEVQLDFDCGVSQLRAYARWVGALRETIRPIRLVITTLPAWLDSNAFETLLHACDGYVLQVHSIPLHAPAANWSICDSALARKWVLKAAGYKKPFAVALPTYRCVAGYSPAGQLLGISMDSVRGSWPPDTTLCEFAANPDDLAKLVRDWQQSRPAELREILWYRLPIETDARNWRSVTFAAVVAGRTPRHQLEVVEHGDNPVDLAIRNNGEADERASVRVIVLSDKTPVAADALTGCSVELDKTKSIFTTNGGALSLRPGEERNIGWLRFGGPAKLKFELFNE